MISCMASQKYQKMNLYLSIKYMRCYNFFEVFFMSKNEKPKTDKKYIKEFRKSSNKLLKENKKALKSMYKDLLK